MSTKGKSVVVIGAGGNIGSHLGPHLARLPGVTRVTLIDQDVYETKNHASQAITPRDVGRKKAGVQARRLRRISSSLTVTALNHAVEDLPLGSLRADVILACLDSRSARQYVNQAAWHLGVPWIDAGVGTEGLLARVNVYLPGRDSPCLECAWDQRDYDALEQTYPCSEPETFSTNAPSSLGALAASLQAIECQKLLSGDVEHAVIGQQLVIESQNHKQYLTSFRRNPECRLFDHEPWIIRRLKVADYKSTLADLIVLMKRGEVDESKSCLAVAGKTFVRHRTCRDCGSRQKRSAFLSMNGAGAKCTSCRGIMFATAVEIAESMKLSTAIKHRSLRSLGLRAGDVVSIENDRGQAHYELITDQG